MNAKDIMFNNLAAVVSESHMTTARENLDSYATDQSFTAGRPPQYVVFPENEQEIGDIVRLANEHRLPIVPKSSSISLYGGGTTHGGRYSVGSQAYEPNPRNQ